MKIARIAHDNSEFWAVIDGDVARAASSDVALSDLTAASLDIEIPMADARLLAPVTPTSKVLCVGLNYRDHVLEMGRQLPDYPVLFTRYPDTFVDPDADLIKPTASDAFDYEAEFAIVIGRGGRAISKADALDHVLGYTILNDGSLRDYQRHTIQFTAGKNFADSGSVGPWIVTPDEFGDVASKRIRSRVSGETRQDSTLGQLIFDVPTLIEYVSTWAPLRPGDIIATGTPGGVGEGFTPPRYLAVGDTLEVEIDGIGTLTHRIAAE